MPLSEPSNDSVVPLQAGSFCRKPPVSERRLQANRRNALRSTGPKTARGKRIVARNAIKHGFLAREVVITAGEGEEVLEEFYSLVDRLWEYYTPTGVVEELLVQTIATCWWRKARVLRAENGEIRRRLDTVAVDFALRNSDKVNLDLTLKYLDLDLFSPENQADGQVSTKERWFAMQGAQTNLRGNHLGVGYLIGLLQKAKSDIASDGCISEMIREAILSAFCFWDSLIAVTCSNAGAKATPPAIVGNKEGDKTLANLAVLIDQRLERLSLFEKYTLDRDNLNRDSETRSFSLPHEIATDKLLRYEAHLDRQLYRAMDELERVQRRSGMVPPPLK